MSSGAHAAHGDRRNDSCRLVRFGHFNDMDRASVTGENPGHHAGIGLFGLALILLSFIGSCTTSHDCQTKARALVPLRVHRRSGGYRCNIP